MLRKLWKYIFPIVNVKYSGFSVMLGAVAAHVYGYAGHAIPYDIVGLTPWLAALLVFVGDFIGEGLWQHGWDILNDRGGLSGFREDPSNPVVGWLARLLIYAATASITAIAVVLVAAGRVMILPIGVAAIMLAYLYSRRRNECIPAVAVALAAAAGWFATTNAAGPELLPVMLIGALTAKISLAFYRYDDYRGLNTVPDFEDDMALLVYYRNVFWLVFLYPVLATSLLLYAGGYDTAATMLSVYALADMVYRRRWLCHQSRH